ncbi:calpain-1 catalytic subunit-like [Spodoptera litura]|uniref:Calpain-1 catalytic subunit-like n=1 Tax=Spodoptera litura TaxID=69820 RepID=A0A9J7ESX2_SPOLT|nr:calpain-1 catalytic subunit-like [Spodoptera litura]
MRKFMRPRADPAPSSAQSSSPELSPKTNGHVNGATAPPRARPPSARPGSGGALYQDAFPPPAGAAPRRPHEMCSRPRFRGDGAEPQPDGGDSWAAGGALGVAAGALALTPRLLDRALPPHSFRHRYVGAFRFRFWVFGEWRDVVVDDRLPARAHCPLGDTVPARAHCPLGDTVPARTARQHCSHDFTLPLLEKAYAKLHGSYAALRDTSVARALQELSGGVVQSFSLRAQPRALTLQLLQAAAPRSSLLATLLLRLRAPAGAPWCGAWAPGSAEWAALAPHDRDILMSSSDSPDDFWISFDDFVDTFSQLELVHVGPDDWLLEPALQARRPWRAVLARRRWRAGFNAGGPPSSGTSPPTRGLTVCCHSWTHYLTATETTGANPQFLMQISQSEGDDASKCHVVVAVTQQYEPGQSVRSLLTVGFALYALRPGASVGASAGASVGARPLDAAHHGRGAARRRASSYRLRALLREAGVSASNKVLEALVLRFARGARLTHEAYVMALARLHVAHERFRSLDSRLKCNPVSLEEMILMTIYS